jgi:uncharacterized protein (TIGR03067 family)
MLRWTLAALALLTWIGMESRGRAEDGLAGKWKIESGTRNGDKIDKEKFEKVEVEFTKDKINLEDKKENNKFVMTYKTHDNAKPNSIEMTIVEGPVKDVSAKGIYELKGNTLRLCYNAMGGDAPKAFESKPDSQNFLFTLKRAK